MGIHRTDLKKAVITSFVLLAVIIFAPVYSAAELTKITVTSLEDTVADDGFITLREAILQANSAGSSEIHLFDLKGEIVLKADLPTFTSDDINICGPGSGILSINGNGKYRVFSFLDGTLSINGITITNAYAKGGNGGNGNLTGGGGGSGMGAAIFTKEKNCIVMLEKVVFTNNKVQGGDGGMIDTSSEGSAGSGGGFNGDGVPSSGILSAAKGGSGGILGDKGQGGNSGILGTNGSSGGFGGGGGGAGKGGVLVDLNGGYGGCGGGGGGSSTKGKPGDSTLYGGAGSTAGGGGGGAGLGGAIFMGNYSYLLIKNCTFRGNAALHGHGQSGGKDGQGKGGAIFINGIGCISIIATSFSGNIAEDTTNSSSYSNEDTPDLCGSYSEGGAATGFPPSEAVDWTDYR